MIKSHKTLEQCLLALKKKANHVSISIEELLQILSGKGKPAILLLLSLPFCQPLQIPGLSTPFGLAISFIGLRITFGKHIWLPKRFLSKKISHHTISKITTRALLLIRKMKRWVYPRMSWMCKSFPMQIINGFTISILGILLALPLPIPLSNLTAAWAIFFSCVGDAGRRRTFYNYWRPNPNINTTYFRHNININHDRLDSTECMNRPL